jgi:hypothetical protein
MGERVGKPHPAADLEQDFGERDAGREHRGGRRAQCAQLLGLVERFEL